MTNEVVRITSFYNSSPKLEIVCHLQDLLFLEGSVITPKMIEAFLISKFDLVDYAYRRYNGVLKLYLEIEEKYYLYDDGMVYGMREAIRKLLLVTQFRNRFKLKETDVEIRIVKRGTIDLMIQGRYTNNIDHH